MKNSDFDTDLEALILPTDAHILNQLANGRRETPVNLAAHIDGDNSYVGNRLRSIAERGYVTSPGPSPRSGMYEITNWGRIARQHIPQYSKGYDALYHTLVKRTNDHQPNTPQHIENDPVNHTPGEPAPDPYAETTTDWIQLTQDEIQALEALLNIDGITIPSDFRGRISADNTNQAADLLYTLHFFGLADRHNNMDAYSASEAAHNLQDSHGLDILRDGERASSLNIPLPLPLPEPESRTDT